MWTRHTKNISSVRDLEMIDVTRDLDAICEIHLNRLDDVSFPKLKEVVQRSPLVKLNLRDCFKDPEKLKEILEAVVDNTTIQSLGLYLRDNVANVACVREIKKLLGKRVLRSLILPEGLDENLMAEILHEILDENVELKEFNLSRSTLDSNCMDLLKLVIQSRLVKEKLGMTGCTGVEDTTLTCKDKKILQVAIQNSRGFFDSFPLKKKLVVSWFTYVKHAGASAETDDKYEICRKEVVRPLFKGKLGEFETVVRLLAREKTGDRWQHIRSYRKRKQEEVVTKQPKRMKEDVDALSEQMKRYSLDSTDTHLADFGIGNQGHDTPTRHGHAESTSRFNRPMKIPARQTPEPVTIFRGDAQPPMSHAHGYSTPVSPQSFPFQHHSSNAEKDTYKNYGAENTVGNAVNHIKFDAGDGSPSIQRFQFGDTEKSRPSPPVHISQQSASIHVNASFSAAAVSPTTQNSPPSFLCEPRGHDGRIVHNVRETRAPIRRQPPRQCNFANPNVSHGFYNNRNVDFDNRTYTNPGGQIYENPGKIDSQPRPRRNNNRRNQFWKHGPRKPKKAT